MPKKSKYRVSPLIIIFAIVFFDLLGFGILIPVIPQLLANPHSAFYLLPHSYSYATGLILLGFLTAVFPFGQFIANPILGQLSDRYGRRRILAFCLFGTALSYALFAYGILEKSLLILFVSRFFDGITGGNISVAQAVIADTTAPKDRAKSFGMIGAAFGLGFILGPYIGGKLSDPSIVSWFNAATPFWFAAILGVANLLAVLAWLPETNLRTIDNSRILLTQSIRNFIKAFSLPDLRVLFTTSFLFQGGFTFYTTFASVFLISRFNFTQGNIGDYFSYIGLWIAFTQAVITRNLANRFSENTILRFSIILMGIVIGLYYLVHDWRLLLLLTPFFAIFNGLSQANLTGLISRSGSAKIQGEILGLSSSVQAMAQVIPAVLSGYIAAKITPLTPILVSCAVVIGAGFIFNIYYKNNKNGPEEDASEPVLSH